jgi:hypothetical protein
MHRILLGGSLILLLGSCDLITRFVISPPAINQQVKKPVSSAPAKVEGEEKIVILRTRCERTIVYFGNFKSVKDCDE